MADRLRALLEQLEASREEQDGNIPSSAAERILEAEKGLVQNGGVGETEESLWDGVVAKGGSTNYAFGRGPGRGRANGPEHDR